MTSTFRYRDDCCNDCCRVFDNTPALIYHNKLHINDVKVLGQPVDGNQLVSVEHLLLAVWIQVTYHNKINEGSGQVLPY